MQGEEDELATPVKAEDEEGAAAARAKTEMINTSNGSFHNYHSVILQPWLRLLQPQPPRCVAAVGMGLCCCWHSRLRLLRGFEGN